MAESTIVTRAEVIRRFKAARFYTVTERLYCGAESPRNAGVVFVRREIERVTSTGVYIVGGPRYAVTTLNGKGDVWTELDGALTMTTFLAGKESMRVTYRLEGEIAPELEATIAAAVERDGKLTPAEEIAANEAFLEVEQVLAPVDSFNGRPFWGSPANPVPPATAQRVETEWDALASDDSFVILGDRPAESADIGGELDGHAFLQRRDSQPCRCGHVRGSHGSYPAGGHFAGVGRGPCGIDRDTRNHASGWIGDPCPCEKFHAVTEGAPALVESAGAGAGSKGIVFSTGESTVRDNTPAWDAGRMTRHYLGIGEIAAHTGLERETVKSYAKEGRLPKPDVTIGDIRGWRVETIDKWVAARPGRGARTDLAGSKGKK